MNKLSKIIPLIISVFLVACVSNPPILVPDSAGNEFISAVSMSCSKPYKLEQDCSGFSGPTKKINLSGVEMKVAGTADGKVVVLFGGKNKGSRGETTNLGYEMMKRELSQNNVNILKATPIVSSNILFGYALETDKPTYQLLSKFGI
ncbi:MAG: hypothetical protein KBT63_12475 [Porticoccaceae bacterium]|nr:hypothetical protein [Porticoccaceae bacterium]